jgi:hypothetical protein
MNKKNDYERKSKLTTTRTGASGDEISLARILGNHKQGEFKTK